MRATAVLLVLAGAASVASFACDGGKQLADDWVNDDYCDCTDGSDEPRTGACHDGALLQCENKLHRPTQVIASRVNDGVCDCCDGSDEYATGVCSNDCVAAGAAARAEAAGGDAVSM